MRKRLTLLGFEFVLSSCALSYLVEFKNNLFVLILMSHPLVMKNNQFGKTLSPSRTHQCHRSQNKNNLFTFTRTVERFRGCGKTPVVSDILVNNNVTSPKFPCCFVFMITVVNTGVFQNVRLRQKSYFQLMTSLRESSMFWGINKRTFCVVGQPVQK